MKKIYYNKVLDRVELSAKEYHDLLTDSTMTTTNGKGLQICIPFPDCSCSNWNESYNLGDYTGILLADGNNTKVTYNQLKKISNILSNPKGELGFEHTSVVVSVERTPLNVKEIDRILAIMDKLFPTVNRETQIRI